MRRDIVVLRHAKSDWPRGVPDDERPLAERGRRDAPAAGTWLREHVPAPDLVLCSTALRTRQTWELVESELDGDPPVSHVPALYGASAADLIDTVCALPSGAHTVLLIGHNPGLEEFVTVLSGSPCVLKTASIAVLRGEGDWRDAGSGWARLAGTAKPRGKAR
ncbi:histidine phosphatase family protein [Saccharomonospora sp. NPDC006951]